MKQMANSLTVLESPNAMVASGYGPITYRQWCELEMARINQKGDDVYIHEFEAWGQIALVRRKRAR
jgi:hypothetical protein